MERAASDPVVHLELHTPELAGARGFYAELCGWHQELVDTGNGPYVALQLGEDLTGGIVQCPTRRSLWLPYVEVPQIWPATERARRLGASVLLGPREGPAGWRSVVATHAGAEIAFWQPKR